MFIRDTVEQILAIIKNHDHNMDQKINQTMALLEKLDLILETEPHVMTMPVYLRNNLKEQIYSRTMIAIYPYWITYQMKSEDQTFHENVKRFSLKMTPDFLDLQSHPTNNISLMMLFVTYVRLIADTMSHHNYYCIVFMIVSIAFPFVCVVSRSISINNRKVWI